MRGHVRRTGIEAALLGRPARAFVFVAVQLLGRLALLRIGIDRHIGWRWWRRELATGGLHDAGREQQTAPETISLNRRKLALWLTRPDHPLTAALADADPRVGRWLRRHQIAAIPEELIIHPDQPRSRTPPVTALTLQAQAEPD